MPKWEITEEWKDQDVCVIGGGPSLRGFDFDRLKGRNTIGCNDAFRLGPEIVKICIFGDSSFFHKTKWDLEKYTGRIVTCAPGLMNLKLDWLHQVPRRKSGLQNDSTLGWNFSTGAAAVNLAISLGAKRIFLLGYDMGKVEGKTHWHNHNPKLIKEASYDRFILGFRSIHHHLPLFPEVKVLNVTDGSSRLPFFPMIGFESFWRYLESDQTRREAA